MELNESTHESITNNNKSKIEFNGEQNEKKTKYAQTHIYVAQ